MAVAISICCLSICCASQDVLDEDDLLPEPCPLPVSFLAPESDVEVPPSVDVRVQGDSTVTLVIELRDAADAPYRPARSGIEPGHILVSHYDGLPPSTQFTARAVRVCMGRLGVHTVGTRRFHTGP